MKKFSFRPQRVMDFRRMQTKLEEIKLEGLHAEMRAIDSRDQALMLQSEISQKALKSAPSVTGFDLELFDSFRISINAQRLQVDKSRTDCRQRIAAQMQVVSAKRRQVRLLEKLKDQRFNDWEQEMFKELDQQAEDAYLAKWNNG